MVRLGLTTLWLCSRRWSDFPRGDLVLVISNISVSIVRIKGKFQGPVPDEGEAGVENI